MKESIIVFGATGKIGTYLIDYIKKHSNDEFRVLAVGKRENGPSFLGDIEYCSMDIADEESFNRLPEDGVFAIINLAAVVTTRVTNQDISSYIKTNVLGAINILEYAKKVRCNRVLYTQTYNDVLNLQNRELVIRPIQGRTPHYKGDFAIYALTKNFAVDMSNYYQENHGIKSFILRLPNVYMYTPNPCYYINGEKRIRPFRKMIQQAINGDAIEIWGSPEHVMDMVYVKDCCQMIFKALLSNEEGGFYNVGTGVGTTLQEQVEGIIKIFCSQDKKSDIIYFPEKPNGPPFIMDISNAEKALGYSPEYTYITMLEDIRTEMELNRFTHLKE